MAQALVGWDPAWPRLERPGAGPILARIGTLIEAVEELAASGRDRRLQRLARAAGIRVSPPSRPGPALHRVLLDAERRLRLAVRSGHAVEPVLLDLVTALEAEFNRPAGAGL